MSDNIVLLELETRLLAAQAQFEEMKAENYQRASLNYSMAYDSFTDIIEECSKILKEIAELNTSDAAVTNHNS